MLVLMWQVDRQWERLRVMEQTLAEQARDTRALRSALARLEDRLPDEIAKRLSERGAVALADPSAATAASIARDATAAGSDRDGFARARAVAAQDDYAEGDWLVRAFATGLATLTPYVSSDAYAAEIQSYVLESALVRDPDSLEWQGLLAESWWFSDDGTDITFRLRPGTRFSDGEPLTADDFAFTFRFVMDERIAAPRTRAFWSKIESVSAPDSRTVVFRFAEPYFNALALAGGMQVLPEHFYARFADDPDRFNQSRALLLGSGPYRLRDPENWTPDAGRVELERNPRYWGPVDPPFERMVWQVISNDTARLTTFRNGDIDVYGARPREFRTLLEDERLMARARDWEYLSPTAGYSYLAWNQRRNDAPTWFADTRVRRAMTLLTDVDRVIDEVFLGYAERAVSPFNPRSPQHDPRHEPQSADVAEALALLEDAGFSRRARDGVLLDPNGVPFTFRLTFFQDNEDTRRMVLFLRDLYARAGIRMEPDPTEWSVMLDRLNRKDFDVITLGWTSGVEVDVYQMFHSSQSVAGGDNFVSFAHEPLDALLDAARGEVDEERRMALWREVEAILVAEQPYTFLMRRTTLALIDRRFEGLKQTELGLNLPLVPIEFFVPVAAQRYGG
ncbi:MAG: ABC transporter substrate-binding protein [Thioalkalivibrionaceae bacterium]